MLSPMFLAMAPFIFLLLLTYPFSLLAHKPHVFSRISVVGVVYCDTCSTNSLSKHSYFLPGVDVNIQCKFKASSPRTAEQISFSVNRTTDRYGTYRLEIPEVDGVDCVDGSGIESLCQASLMKSSSPACNVPGLKTTTDQISVKSKQDNHCIYSLNALNYRPKKRNETLCRYGKQQKLQNSLNSSKFFVPYFPPYGFLWPPYPPLPHLPFPPFPYPQPPSLPFPFPPLPPLPYLPFPPFPYPQPPSLPFPFPPRPPTPYLFQPPPPPGFDLGDPRTWIPHIPPLSLTPPPPPPGFNLGDPRTWIPHIPPLSSTPPPPPPPPAFNLGDPRTWIPYLPPSPPHGPQNQIP